MDRLYELIRKSKLKDEQAILSILHQFEPCLKKCLYQTTINSQEDLSQELKIKVIEAIANYNIDLCPSFWDFINQDEKNISE